MARIRTIKPEFPQSETIGRLSRDARLTFVLLWTIADDSGRARASSRMLASLLYPYDEDAPSLIDEWMAELEREGCVRRYVVDGSHYLEITNWLKHQKIDRPGRSKLPEFIESSRALANDREGSSGDLGPRTLDLGPRLESPNGDSCRVAKTRRRPQKQKSDKHASPLGKKNGLYAEAFDALWKSWQAHGRGKGSKKQAGEAWNTHVAKPGLDPAMVVARASLYCGHCRANDTLTVDVVRFLRHHRWEDDLGPVATPGDRLADAFHRLTGDDAGDIEP